MLRRHDKQRTDQKKKKRQIKREIEAERIVFMNYSEVHPFSFVCGKKQLWMCR